MMYEPIKPRPIEAMLLTFENQAEVMAWCGGKTWSKPPMRAVTGIQIELPLDVLEVPFGNYILKLGVRRYTDLTAKEFEALYRPVNNTQPPQGNES